VYAVPTLAPGIEVDVMDKTVGVGDGVDGLPVLGGDAALFFEEEALPPPQAHAIAKRVTEETNSQLRCKIMIKMLSDKQRLLSASA